MAPYVSATAKKNLQKGIRKMERTMTAAAQVRRNFQLGRPKTATTDEPLHPAVVWQRANAALMEFRSRMSAAKLDPADATALIVYVEPPVLDEPKYLVLEGPDGEHTTPEDHQRKAFEELGRENTLALGLIFQQYDRDAIQEGGGAGRLATFPNQFMGLTPRGMTVLKEAATQLNRARAIGSRRTN